ncbi:hypothetical protein FKM82_005513 [Ascaphus truei]
MDATTKPLRIPPEMSVYAEENKVFDILQKMVGNLLVDRPEDPIQYLIDHLRNDNDEIPRIFLLGPPASGKHTMAKLVCKHLNATHLTPEDLLSNDGPLLAKEALSYRDKGQEIPNGLWAKLIQERLLKVDCKKRVMPDNLVLKILARHLSRLDCATYGWVLHGFPRDTDQAGALNYAGFHPNRVFFLDIPDDAAMERMSLCVTDPVSGERYHSIYKPAPRIEVHDRLQQNPKDCEQKVQERLDIYHANAEELEEFYQDVIHVNADQDPYTVFEFIESCIVKPIPKRAPEKPMSP